ncbi:hypothetical protein N656DRAFT_826922 [Canariomyces notabilis]|uniref:HIT-type domain-containing protein n=1 Tax=Canariomyces notabilis TaxID=2074819 RepID=A0AAN6TJV6_9PEZI|nr:hypothetical protein N656DRAFT_826922 [Canariomyces arenarius]
MDPSSQNAGSSRSSTLSVDDDLPAEQTAMLRPGPSEPSVAAPAEPPAVADSGASPGPPSPPAKKPEPKLCGVCSAQPGKYKCPRCSMPYCSVACNKQHKENHPPDPPPPERQPEAQNPTPTQESAAATDDDPYTILLDHREAFARLFQKYPTLAAELNRIQQATLPPPAADDDTNGRHNQQQRRGQGRAVPWTRDVGLRKGAAALRKARTDPSETGDGVREFCELVLFLLSKQEEQQKEKEKRGVIGRVREEVAAEEMGVIERLLREEGG